MIKNIYIFMFIREHKSKLTQLLLNVWNFEISLISRDNL